MGMSQFNPSNLDSWNEAPKEGKMICNWIEETKNYKQTKIENEHHQKKKKKVSS
jgi:hypothetical protein